MKRSVVKSYRFVDPMGMKFFILLLIFVPFLNACQRRGPESKQVSLEDRLKSGKAIYLRRCATCHQSEGQGLFTIYPPLANSDWLKRDVKTQAISSIKNGKKGKITVNGKDFNGVMPAMALSDQQIADVLTYVYHSWGNNNTIVTENEVSKVSSKSYNGKN